MSIKILVADGLDKEALAELGTVSDFEVIVNKGMSEDELIAAIPDCDAVVVRSASKITAKVIENAPKLKIAVRAGIGLDNIDQNAAKCKNIEVRNTPSATTISVAEQAMGMMLAAVRNIGKANCSMKAHKWEKSAFTGTELYGKTLGVVGFGRIGQETARRAHAFGMNILAYDVVELKCDFPMCQVALDEIYAKSDIITFHLPKTDTSKNMVNAEAFAKMKDGVVIVNASRGGIVSEKDLLAALESGKVRSAALDVFEKEPPVDFALIDHPNVTATPHLGASAKEGQARAGMEVVRILKERLLKCNV